MRKKLFAKKSIESLIKEASDNNHELKRSLSPFSLIGMGIGAIIGAGFFVLIGSAASYAGPSVILSFIIAAIICAFSAFCYAEFASLIPVSGSAYSYAYATLGEFVAWTIGWVLTLEFLFSPTTVAVGWSGYFVSLLKDFSITIPDFLCKAPLNYDLTNGWIVTGSLINLPALVIVAIIGFFISIGVHIASFVNNLMVVIKVGVILLFLVCGIAFFNSDNLIPFIPDNLGNFGQFGLSGVFRAAGLVFFAFIGFDAVATFAQECKNPKKDLPIAMLGSLGITTIIYVVVTIVLLGIVKYTDLAVPDPLAVAVNALGPNFIWLRYVLKIGITVSLTSVILVMLLGQARIFYSMSKDGLLPKPFGKIHKKFKTPFFSSVVITIFSMVFAALFPVEMLAQITVMGALLAFLIVSLGILILRKTDPKLHRPFKTPLVPYVPLLGVITCLIQMIALPLITWIQLVIWLIIGYLIYFGYGIKHSVLHKK